MFKELVEKNSNEETEGNEKKRFKSQNGDENDEFGGIFNFSGIGNSQFEIPSNGDNSLHGLEAKEQIALPLFNTTGRAMWN